MRNRYKYLLLVFFALLFIPLLPVGYTNNDETHLYYFFTFSLRWLPFEFLNSLKLAFYTFLSNPRASLPILIASPLFSFLNAAYSVPELMRGISITLHGLNLILFWRVLSLIFSSGRAAYLGVLLFLVFMQNSWDHNLLTCNVPHLILFGFVQFSFLLFYRCLQGGKVWYGMLSAICYFLALSYETNIVYFPLFWLLAFAHVRGESGKSALFPEVWRHCRQVTILTVVYLAVYFCLRYFITPASMSGPAGIGFAAPGVDSGYSISIGFNKLLSIVRVIVSSAIAGFPAFRYFVNYKFISEYCAVPWAGPFDVIGLIKNLQVLWLLKALLAGAAVYALLKELRAKPPGPVAVLLFLAVYLTFAPGVPISVVEKYQFMAKIGSVGMINTYHSFFGAIVLFLAGGLWLNRLLPAAGSGWRVKAAVLALPVSVAVLSVVTDFTNHAYAVSQVQSQKKWESVDALISSAAFKALPPGSVIYAPSLFRQIGIMGIFRPYWTDYIEYKTGGTYNILRQPELIRAYVRDPRVVFKAPGHERVRVVGTREELKELVKLKAPENFYYLRYDQEKQIPNQYIVLGKVNRVVESRAKLKFYGDSFQLLDLTKYPEVFISGNIGRSLTGKVRKRKPGDDTLFNDDFFVMPRANACKGPAGCGVEVKNVLLDSIILSGSLPARNSAAVVSLDFGEGVYPGEGETRWCQKSCAVYITNDSATPQTAAFRAEFSTKDQPTSRMEVVGDDFGDSFFISTAPVTFSKVLRVRGNSDVRLLFNSSAKKLDAPGDPRNLYFKVMKASAARVP